MKLALGAIYVQRDVDPEVALDYLVQLVMFDAHEVVLVKWSDYAQRAHPILARTTWSRAFFEKNFSEHRS